MGAIIMNSEGGGAVKWALSTESYGDGLKEHSTPRSKMGGQLTS